MEKTQKIFSKNEQNNEHYRQLNPKRENWFVKKNEHYLKD